MTTYGYSPRNYGYTSMESCGELINLQDYIIGHKRPDMQHDDNNCCHSNTDDRRNDNFRSGGCNHGNVNNGNCVNNNNNNHIPSDQHHYETVDVPTATSSVFIPKQLCDDAADDTELYQNASVFVVPVNNKNEIPVSACPRTFTGQHHPSHIRARHLSHKPHIGVRHISHKPHIGVRHLPLSVAKNSLSIFSSLLCCQGNEEEGGMTTDTATTENSHKHDKDSGVGRTDDSTKNDESSEQEMLENDCTSSPASNPKFGGAGGALSGSSADLHYSNDSFTDQEGAGGSTGSGGAAAAAADFRQVLETRCNGNNSSSQSSIEHEIAALNQEMAQIQLECQEIVEAHARESSSSTSRGAAKELFRSPRSVPRMGTRLDYLKQLHGIAVPENNPPEVWARGLNPSSSDPNSSGVSTMDSSNRKTSSGSGASSKDYVNAGADAAHSSAYNSGESSCRSTPLTLELHQNSDDSGKGGHKTSMLCLAAPTSAGAASKTSQDSERKSKSSSDSDSKTAAAGGALAKSRSNSSSVSRMSQTQEDLDNEDASLQELYTQYADVMYTNQANLQHTIMVQQKLFQQQLMQRACKLNNNAPTNGSSSPSSSPAKTSKTPENGLSPSHSTTSNPLNHIYEQIPSPTAPTPPPPPPPHRTASQEAATASSAGSGQMEWVVKRRADGSRYITRRPVRSKLLKERARKVAEERCGLTTDDDAVSELKVGRYWSKEERKRHLEKAKDHRKKKESLRSKMETVKEAEENSGGGGSGGHQSSPKKEPNIVELSHRKMMKHKGRKVLDDFTTVQELMAHGSREPQGKTYNPLLSVTTV